MSSLLGTAYTFALDLRTDAGEWLELRVRYHEAYAIHRRIEELEPAVALPPFPAKHSLRRQTPEFLHQRGTALACYLQAALAEPRVVALDEVRALLADARPAVVPVTPPALALEYSGEVIAFGGEAPSPLQLPSPLAARGSEGGPPRPRERADLSWLIGLGFGVGVLAIALAIGRGAYRLRGVQRRC